MDQARERIRWQPHLRHGWNQRLRLSRPGDGAAPARVLLQTWPTVFPGLARNAGGPADRRPGLGSALAPNRGALAARARTISFRRATARPKLSRQIRQYQTPAG